MPSFVARIQTRKGIKMIPIEALDRKEADRIAKRHGRVMSINRKIGFDLTPGMTVSERFTWMTRMSMMVGSKMGSAEGLRLMAASFSGNIKRASEAMLERVEAGMDIPDAMAQDPKNFPVTTTALVRAGAAAGNTKSALKDAADFEYEMSNVHRGSMKEVWSAIGSFLTAGGLVIGTNEYFGPMVMDNPMFLNADLDYEWARTAGDICTWIMIVMLVFFAMFFWLGTAGRQIMPNVADKVILRIPYYKDLILARNNHVTLYKLSLLIQSGVRIEDALSHTAESSPRGALKTDLIRALTAVRSGRPWAQAMSTLHATDKAALTISSNRDDIARTLGILATQYSDLYMQRMSTFAPTLAMVAALFMSIAGGLMFAQTILPMLQLSASY